MAGFYRAVRARRKLLLIWGLLILFIGAAQWQRYCSGRGQLYCTALEEYGWLVVVAALFISLGLFLLTRRREKSLAGTFAFSPEEFHEEVITLQGKVKYILPNSTAERVRRKMTDKIRTFMDDDNSTGRYIHQRFLLTSNELRRGACVLVEHNVNYGKAPLKIGARIEVQGIYLHTVDKRSRHPYGRIHFTHAPHGYLKIL